MEKMQRLVSFALGIVAIIAALMFFGVVDYIQIDLLGSSASALLIFDNCVWSSPADFCEVVNLYK